MISCQNLSFSYGRKKALQSLDLSIAKGRICGLLGKNGAGKTTLLKILSGQLMASGGTAQVLGMNPEKRTKALYQDLAFVGDTLATPNMRLSAYAKLVGPLYPDYSVQEFTRLCKAFLVDPEQKFTEYSSGSLRKAWLSFAMACGTRLLILDEPSQGLDIPSQDVLRRELASWAGEDRLIILSTHHVLEVEQLIDYLVILQADGKLGYASSLDTLHKEYSVVENTSGTADAPVLARTRIASGWKLLLKKPADRAQAVNMELLFQAFGNGADAV